MSEEKGPKGPPAGWGLWVGVVRLWGEEAGGNGLCKSFPSGSKTMDYMKFPVLDGGDSELGAGDGRKKAGGCAGRQRQT